MDKFNNSKWFRENFGTNLDLDTDGDEEINISGDEQTGVITIRSATDEDTSKIFNFLNQLRSANGDLSLVSVASTSDQGGTLTQLNNKKIKFDPGQDFQYLANGETATVVFTGVAGEADDGDYEDLVGVRFEIDITGLNDDVIIDSLASTVSGEITEIADGGAGETIADLSTTGSIQFSDADLSDTHTVVATPSNGGIGYIGTFAVGAPTSTSTSTTGAVDWSFTVNDGLLDSLSVGEIISQEYLVSISDGNGSTATETVTIIITGTNDAPTLAAGFVDAVEDGPTVDVDLAALGADIDSDDDGGTLTYAITGAPSEGSASITGTILTFDPGLDFQDLALGETRDVAIEVTATDAHGATAVNTVIVTVTGTNDAPMLAMGFVDAVEDGPTVDVDLAALGADVDSDDDGGTLTYAITGAPSEGSASITGTILTFDPGSDFQDLALDETRDVTVQVTATDAHGAAAQNTVTVTVTGTNDAPPLISATVINGIDANDSSSSSVSSAGDVNGDGIDDILIGARRADPNGQTYAGESYVVYGKSGGLGASVNLSDLDGSNGFVINGIDRYDYSGWSVSGAGDVNGDGIDDVLIGARYADPNGKNFAGESYVVYGKSGGFGASVNLSDLDGSNGFVINGIDRLDYSGSSVSNAGDVNGDGIDDILIGAYGADPNGQTSAGESYVVYGKSGGLGASVNLSDLDGSNGFVINGIDVGDFSGVSVSSAGDVNGDGIDDILIGAYGADPNGQFLAGESYVVYGQSGGLDASVNLSDLDGSNGFVINGIDRYDYSGFSVSSAGDVNGDGIDDILIGAYLAGPNGQFLAGESYVVYGKSGGVGASVNLSDLDGSNGFVINGIDVGDFSGYSVSSAGDVNGDGIDDILIGAYGADSNGQNANGESYVVYGKSGGLGASVNLSDLDGSNGFVIIGIDDGDLSGYSVSSAGDVNGDGIDDILIGAADANIDGQIYAGESYVVYGGEAQLLAYDAADGLSDGQIQLQSALDYYDTII